MIVFIAFIIVLLAIGLFVVLRSGSREVAMDKKDRELSVPSTEFQMLPSLKLDSDESDDSEGDGTIESWTLDSVEDDSKDHEGE